MWHQWQRHDDEVTAGVGVEWSAVEFAGVVAVDALLVVMVSHGWAGGAGTAGTAAAATGEGTATSTASEAGNGEP
ncbi:MAG: hypothetical protein H7Z19_03060 [Chitinophagaceae bacterium]|nr:hypothetical protein [Rubrivivax sp.]